MAIAQVNLRLNTAGLRASLAQVRELSGDCAAYLANRACNSIANRVVETMPVVTADRITAEMNARTADAEMSTGKLADARFRRNRTLTMAQKIVLARMHPNSNFNRRTGGVWALAKPEGTGGSPSRSRRYMLSHESRRVFWSWVDDHAARMIAARRKSSGFYRLGAMVIRLIFGRGRTPVRMPPSDGAVAASAEATTLPGDGKVGQAIGRVAGGTRATKGSVARASFWVSTTEPDSKGSNEGITRVLEPIWQRAVSAEAANQAARAEALYTAMLQKNGFTVK